MDIFVSQVFNLRIYIPSSVGHDSALDFSGSLACAGEQPATWNFFNSLCKFLCLLPRVSVPRRTAPDRSLAPRAGPLRIWWVPMSRLALTSSTSTGNLSHVTISLWANISICSSEKVISFSRVVDERDLMSDAMRSEFGGWAKAPTLAVRW